MDIRKLNETLEDAAMMLKGRPPKSFLRGTNELLETVKRSLVETNNGSAALGHRKPEFGALREPLGPTESEAVATKMAADIIADVLARYPSLKLGESGGVPAVTTGDGNVVAVTTAGEGSSGFVVHAYTPAASLFAWQGQPANTSLQPSVPVEEGLGDDGQYNEGWLPHSQSGKALVLNIAHQLGADLAPGREG